MSSSTDRRLLRIAGVAACGAAAAAAASLAGAPGRASRLRSRPSPSWPSRGARVVAWPGARGGRGRGPREQGELFDHMLDAIDAERETLAHCLHDGPQQTLTAVRLMCDVVRDAISKGDVHHAEEVLGRLERLAADAADDLRRTVARLHPVVMQQQGLVQALGSLAETVHEEYGVATSFNRPARRLGGRGGPRHGHLPDRARGGGERRPARAAAGPDQPPALVRGHPPLASRTGAEGSAATATGRARESGIRMMRERAARIGAELTLESAPGHPDDRLAPRAPPPGEDRRGRPQGGRHRHDRGRHGAPARRDAALCAPLARGARRAVRRGRARRVHEPPAHHDGGVEQWVEAVGEPFAPDEVLAAVDGCDWVILGGQTAGDFPPETIAGLADAGHRVVHRRPGAVPRRRAGAGPAAAVPARRRSAASRS